MVFSSSASKPCSQIFFFKAATWYNVNSKSMSYLVTVLPLQKHQMLVGKHLRYQSKENCLSRARLPGVSGSQLPRYPSLCSWLAWGTAVGWISIPSADNRLRKEHLVNAICFGIPFNFFISLARQQHAWWICAGTFSSCCHPLFVCSMSLPIPVWNWAAASHVEPLPSSVFVCLKSPGWWDFIPG